MSLQRVPVNNFRGGLNTRDSPFELQPNESPDLRNVTISSLVGQLETRKGKLREEISGVSFSNADFMKQVVIGNGKRFLLASAGGSVYAVAPGNVCKEVFKGTPGTIFDFEVFADAAFKDWVYISNGVDAPQKWDGEAAKSVEWKATLGTIPKGGVLCVWENRMFVSFVTANVQRVYFSEFGDPEATLKEYGFVDVRGPEEDLDAVQDLCVLGARLIVLKRRSVYFISSAVTMLNRRIGSPGVWGRFQVAELENKLYFFNPQGIFATGGVNVLMESGSINNYFPEHLNKKQFDKVRMIATKDTYPRLLVAMPTDGSIVNNTMLEMIPHINFRRIGGRRYLLLPAFFLHTMYANALACWNPNNNEEQIWVDSSDTIAKIATEMTLLDALTRAENPLSNGAKWKAVTGGTGVDTLLGWEPTELKMHATQVRWSAAQFHNPCIVMADIVTIDNIAQNVMLDMLENAGVTDGYEMQFSWEVGRLKRVSVLRAGSTIGATTGDFTPGVHGVVDKIAASVFGKTINLFIHCEKVGWVNVFQMLDPGAEIAEGYVGFRGEREEVGAVLKNFRVIETFTTSSILCQAFATGEEFDNQTLPIEARWQSSWMAIQGEEPKERLRRINAELSGLAQVEVYKDFESTPAFTQELPQAGVLKEYAEPSAAGAAYRFTRVRPETWGRFHSFRVKNIAGSKFLINFFELVVRGGKEH